MQNDALSRVTLAILAGGAGSRMGMPKGELLVGGRPILRYLLDRFDWPGPTLLVTAPGREHPPGWESFTQEAVDPVGGLGPMRGVLTALEHARTEQVLVTPVDMPGLLAGQLRWLVSAFEGDRSCRRDLCGLMLYRKADCDAQPGCASASERRVEPLPAVFHREAAALIRARLEAGRGSVHALTDEPGFLVVDAPGDWSEETWSNMNRPSDLQRFLKATRETSP